MTTPTMLDRARETIRECLHAMDIARDCIQPITGAQIRLHNLNPRTDEILDSAAEKANSVLADLERARADNGWLPIATAPSGIAVLVYYKNAYGKGRIVKARHIARFTEESESDCEEGVDEYDEQNDRSTYTEGWWEMLDNWPEYGFVKLESTNIPTNWQPLPATPITAESTSREVANGNG